MLTKKDKIDYWVKIIGCIFFCLVGIGSAIATAIVCPHATLLEILLVCVYVIGCGGFGCGIGYLGYLLIKEFKKHLAEDKE